MYGVLGGYSGHTVMRGVNKGLACKISGMCENAPKKKSPQGDPAYPRFRAHPLKEAWAKSC